MSAPQIINGIERERLVAVMIEIARRAMSAGIAPVEALALSDRFLASEIMACLDEVEAALKREAAR